MNWKDRVRELACRVGAHQWRTHFSNVVRLVERCQRCGKYRSTMYDMTTGSTYWVDGDRWSGGTT